MVLDKIPGPKIFTQRDVRETPAGSATATSLSVIDATYLTLSLHADLTDERVMTAGEGIDFNDTGANGNLTISGEDASTTNKGIASFNTTHFTVAGGAVSAKNFHAESHNAASHSDITASGADIDSAVSLKHAESHNMASHTDDYSAGAGIDISGGNVISGENATTSNKGIASFSSADFDVSSGAVSLDDDVISQIATSSGTATGVGHKISILQGTGIVTSASGANTQVSLKNKTSYWSVAGSEFHGSNPNTDDVSGLTGSLIMQGSNINVRAKINLPHGAVITAAVVWGSATDETWSLIRDNTDADTISGTIVSNQNIETETIGLSETVDNSQYGYYFLTTGMDVNDKVYGARVTYTTDYV